MTVVLFDEKTPSVRERARLNEIDVLVEASKGIETAGDAIIVAYADFRSGKRRFGVSSTVGVLAPASAIRIHDDFDREIVEMIAVGYGDRDISDAVFLSHQTVRNRVSRILHDNDMKNRTHLACKYLKLMHDERQLFEGMTLSAEKNCSKKNNQLPINSNSQSIGAP